MGENEINKRGTSKGKIKTFVSVTVESKYQHLLSPTSTIHKQISTLKNTTKKLSDGE